MSFVIRRYNAAPGVGLVGEDSRRKGVWLSDRVANGEAFPGETVVRVPRRFFKSRYGVHARGFWNLKRELAGEVAS